MQVLDARHPGLREKVDAMLAEFWRTRDIKHMIAAHYGERLSMSSVERYKRKHWHAQRERVEPISELIGSSFNRSIGPSGHRPIS